jgi:16S rRNA (adenine1518-N6/adenine1519-N6)-dimethyltransferase
VTLTEIRRILGERQIQLTRSLGQNFLHDGNQLRRIADAAHLTDADRVLEIGPGLGPLTEILVSRAAKVLAIEMDLRLVSVLQERFPQDERLELLHADALDIVRDLSRNWTGWKLVSNLPYSVASPILVELALSASPPALMVATLQLEVINRIVAQPDSKDYGILTLLLGLKFEAVESFKIGRECFFPVPDVDSGCVVLKLRPAPLVGAALENAFVRVVKTAFSQRRKMMLKLLKQHWPMDRLDLGFAAAGISAQERAEKVSPRQFAILTEYLHPAPAPVSE